MYLNKGNPNFKHGCSVLKKAELLAMVSSSCVLASKKGKECLILSANETAQWNTVCKSLLSTLQFCRDVGEKCFCFLFDNGKKLFNKYGSGQNVGPGSGCLVILFYKECSAPFLRLLWQSVKNIRNILKVRKGHLSLFFEIKRISDLNWSFCGEYTLTPTDTGDSLSPTF